LQTLNDRLKEETEMKRYGGIDLHSNNCVIELLDENDRSVFQQRMGNDLPRILSKLAPWQSAIQGVAVESTFNWYWLVDGLMDAGYRVHLVNTAAIKKYEGLKYTDDHWDSRWLAHLLRLGILPEGYIYPREERAVRDLLRKRGQLVQQRTSNILSIGNLVSRNTGGSMSGNRIKKLRLEDVEELFTDQSIALAVKSNLVVMQALQEQVKLLESAVKVQVKLKPSYEILLSVPGIGEILGLTIMLETGDIRRFAKVGQYASYCRCVGSTWISNGKQKGKGNSKNGNKYLAWAFVEAANFAIRYNDRIKGYYQRKAAKTNPVVAKKTIAHKLARACFYMMRDQKPFDLNQAFG
jgi:transposase